MNFKINDIITALVSFDGITKGRDYKVERIVGNQAMVYVKDDTGSVSGYLAKRFKPMVRATPLFDLSPQNQTVLKHLLRTGSITQREALMDHSIQSLTKRISELREHGYDIKPVTKKHPITGQRYVRYELDKQPAQKAAYPTASNANDYILAA